MITLFLIITNSFCRLQSGKWEAKIEEFPFKMIEIRIIDQLRTVYCTLSVLSTLSVSEVSEDRSR